MSRVKHGVTVSEVYGDNGLVAASFYGPDRQEIAERYEQFLVDPRSTQWTAGFCAGLECARADFDKMCLALAWLSREQAKLSPAYGDPLDIYREAIERGEAAFKEST